MDEQTSTYECQGLRIILTTSEHTISDVLEAVEYVLRGQGYFFNGHVGIVDEE